MDLTEYNSETEQEIRDTFPLEVVFEHDQWWVVFAGVQFSVIETSEGIDLEEL